jgi:hypothetical protein
VRLRRIRTRQRRASLAAPILLLLYSIVFYAYHRCRYAAAPTPRKAPGSPRALLGAAVFILEESAAETPESPEIPQPDRARP